MADLWNGIDFRSDGLDAFYGETQEEMVERWDREYPPAAKNGHAVKSNGHNAPKPLLRWADTSRWDSEPCPPREWAVRDRIPLRQVTLLSGEGSIGKSIIELMCAVAHVTGKDWLKSLPEPGGAFYIGCEDDEAELRIRLSAIVSHYGTTFDELKASGFRFVSLAGEDAVLGAPDRNNIIKPTALFNHLYEQAGDLKPKHIGIDTSADVFAGNESDRAQVRQFISLLRKLAIVANGSVVLLSHPSLTGINSGSGISGSTAWHNSVRARMYMTAPKMDQGEQPDTDLRELHFKKSNYGPVSDNIVLRYQGGLFLPERGISNLDKLNREAAADEAFLAGLRAITQQGRDAIAGRNSSEYGPTLIAGLPEIKSQCIRKQDMQQAMERLLAANKIHIGLTDGAPSKAKKRINLGPRVDGFPSSKAL
jgi:RecA-family ATPase